MQQRTIRRKTPRAKRANLLRRRRRQAIAQGPPRRPSPAASPSTSAASSGSPVTVPCEAVPGSPGAASTPGFSESGDTSGSRSDLFREFETGEFGLEGRIPDRGFQIDVVGDEERQRPGPVRSPGRFFHEFFVQFRIFLFLLRTE